MTTSGTPARPGTLHADHALLPGGWARDVQLAWDEAGLLTAVEPGSPHVAGTEHAAGPLLPGIANLHSHAFQRAFAGLTEYRGSGDDSFWSWRERMYRFAAALTPETLEDVATQLYVEMLHAGYTHVCEFHYVHDAAPDGSAHSPAAGPQGHALHGGRVGALLGAAGDPAEMSLRLVSAARRAGIGLTMLPVLYQASGFGGRAPSAGQRRFIRSVDRLLGIVERLRGEGVRVGAAPHSLRAVAPPALRDLVDGLHCIDPGAPVHIHIAEQQREVDDCLAWSGQRPVQWLLDHAAVDARWCLVHATHVDDAESVALAASGAVAGLCPTTEANLGDGVFPAAAYDARGGAWGIGSDSHASVSLREELRLLEYGQRLVLQRRNVMATAARPQVADHLWLSAAAGGARAAGVPMAGLAVGQRADFVVLDGDAERWAGLDAGQRLAAHVFAQQRDDAAREVWVAGNCVVRDGRHALGAEAARRFAAARAAWLRAA